MGSHTEYEKTFMKNKLPPDRIPERISSLSDPVYEESVERYRFAITLLSGGRVLDVACGSGHGTLLLAKIADRVYGIDSNEQAIASAQKLAKIKRNVVFQKGDANRLPFPDHFFDAVVSFETIEHLPNWRTFLLELKRVVKSEGLFLLSTPDRSVTQNIVVDTTYRNPFHLREFTLPELKKILSQYFTVESVYGQFIYRASPIRSLLRDLLRIAVGWDRRKWLKRILPLGIVVWFPRFLAGMKGDVKVHPLKKGEQAQDFLIVFRNSAPPIP